MNAANKKIALAIIVLIVGVVVAALIITGGDDEGSSTEQTSAAEQLPVNNTQPAKGAEAPDVVEEATLSPVNNYDATGTATRSYEEGQFMHEIVATIQQPAEGKFYEGWLVGERVVSTGRLDNEGGNDWSLVFTTEEDLSSFDRIVVTEETEADGLDGKPETHVLEGSF